ncbi:LmbE family N-acetylglucosaminyl deacetylase [Mucilaginibacter gracilis]|uniref:LmbE family N-acetylglucosaminyl deacetylase n=1 Tax=Mucilaginibacter gracilis TaxID=423350 RepID=A0A495IZZ8_9SPHI|nr:PIG-L family deacetylase [Mucilaginibacter gracilis]RKR81409.1 LmbE family N-acetylglucosaminyl deacetylase [Mucilaginibacter gracilis]
MAEIKLFTAFFYFLLFNLLWTAAAAQTQTTLPHVLVVMAHPDDESVFSVALYKIAKEHHGIVDILTVTNGEAGYKYSTLAENFYGVELTNEKTGRANLPRIRKREVMNAGNILGVSQYYFLDQLDSHYGINEREPLDTSWDVSMVKTRIKQLLIKNKYDFVFTLLPEPGTHAGHKAATLLALDVISELPEGGRPVVLGGITHNKVDSVFKFSHYANYRNTQTVGDTSMFAVNRLAAFSYKNRVNYKVIVNWEIAEHKSQGVMQMAMNDGDYEQFWYFAISGKAGIEKAAKLFADLKITPYVPKKY